MRIMSDKRRNQFLTMSVLIVVAILSLGSYIVWSSTAEGPGFPLDDAWIHQTYARNLIQHTEWSFIPGFPSGGSTAPLWSAILAIGYIVGISTFPWAYFLGFVMLLCLAYVCNAWLKLRSPHFPSWFAFIGLIILLEWHLVWAALSGMETLAIALLAAFVLMQMNRDSGNFLLIGAFIGVGIWIRPDALLLVLPAMWILIFRNYPEWKKVIRQGLLLTSGLLAVALPYLFFNMAITGSIWPNTFYAKQAEYAVLSEIPLWTRILDQVRIPLVGVGILLLPGIVAVTVDVVRTRSWGRIAPLLWILTYLLLYAYRLPVTYQHGRYAMPVIPVVIVLGLEGFAILGDRFQTLSIWRTISRTWGISIGVVLVIFWVIGGRAYVRDVAIIETEMVAAAKWIEANTPAEALIAGHDIGALGYYGDRQIMDLAGLISPEVIPIIRDEDALAEFLDAREASYLMTFPGWYPKLIEHGDEIYSTLGVFSPEAGGENMHIYSWKNDRLPLGD